MADNLARIGGAGFAGLVLHRESRQITSYWVGEPPADVKRYAAQRPGGIVIELVPDARFGRAQLRAAARRLGESRQGAEAGVVTVALNYDGSGLQVDVRGRTPDPAARAKLAEVAGLPASVIRYTPYSDLDGLAPPVINTPTPRDNETPVD